MAASAALLELGRSEDAARSVGVAEALAPGWEALTPTERDVAASVADGNTNAAVADELFISANTVKTHLKSIYAKLGIGSRVELVTVVAANTK